MFHFHLNQQMISTSPLITEPEVEAEVPELPEEAQEVGLDGLVHNWLRMPYIRWR